MKKNKNKYQILPLAVLLLILTISFSALSASGNGEGNPHSASNSGIQPLSLSEADSAEDEHICGLNSVDCSFEADDSAITVKHGGESALLSAGSSTLGIISFYSAIDSCHTGASCLMANGKRAQIGYVACPRRYKLGIKVRIDGKVYECGDRTAKWVDGRWDIFTGYGKEAYRLALQNGLKTKIVEIL